MVQRLHNPHNLHHSVWSSILLTLLVATLACAPPARAQGGPITLTVQVLTVAREPVPNIAVQVVDAATNQQLGEGTTDQRGQARFTALPPTEIRVRLTGQLANDTRLRHTRQDQRGIWVNLPGRDWVMDLRVDTDGLVFPDLGLGNAGAPDAGAATSIAEGTLPTLYPTAPLATVVPQTTRRQLEVVQAPAVRQTAVSPTAPVPTSQGPGTALLLLAPRGDRRCRVADDARQDLSVDKQPVTEGGSRGEACMFLEQLAVRSRVVDIDRDADVGRLR